MPDHIHFVVHVKERLTKHLGNELNGFFSACSSHYSCLKKLGYTERLFHPYHDSILFNVSQLDKAIRYVEDNPRRLIIKRMYPDLFKSYQNLKIAGCEFSAFGNMFLLRKPWLLPVRIHRRWSEREMENYVDKCEKDIENGAVPISPGIHRVERKILQIAVDLEIPVIKLREKDFGERFKPYGKDFDLCAEGRLLLLAPKLDNSHTHQKTGYKEFHDMNDLAFSISTLTPDCRFSLSISKNQ